MNKKNVTINFKRGERKDGLLSAIAAADEHDLRLMLALSLISSESEKLDCAPIAEELGLSESELDASIKYWCGAGLLKKSARGSCAKKDAEKVPESAKSAHKDGKLERGSELPSYSSAELSELIEKRRITAEFIDEAQRIIGKVFNSHEVGLLVGMVDYVGFDESCVIIILSEMVKNDKRSLRYAEKLAFSLYDMGITTASGLQEYFRGLEESKKTESLVRSMFGMSGRALTPNESRYLNSWINKMGFGVDVIRLAYDITVDKTQTPSPAYANAILKKWHGEGLRTAEDVARYEEQYKKVKGEEEKKDEENSSSAPPEVKDIAEDAFFTYDKVKNMSRDEIRKNYKNIIKSMEKWK